MRIALISDIHGNEIALAAVLRDIDHVGVDRLVCLGDVATLGPSPASVIQKLQQLRYPCILGNHDEFLLDAALIHTYTEVPVIVEAVDWCRSQLSRDALDFLRTFQPLLEIRLDKHSTLLCYHGSPRSHMEDILSSTAPEELQQALAGYDASVMAGGHTHIQMLRQHRGTLIVNPGSVGAPFREFVRGSPPTVLSHAEYAIVEGVNGAVNVTLRRVPLNKDALREAVSHGDNPFNRYLLQHYA